MRIYQENGVENPLHTHNLKDAVKCWCAYPAIIGRAIVLKSIIDMPIRLPVSSGEQLWDPSSEEWSRSIYNIYKTQNNPQPRILAPDEEDDDNFNTL